MKHIAKVRGQPVVKDLDEYVGRHRLGQFWWIRKEGIPEGLHFRIGPDTCEEKP